MLALAIAFVLPLAAGGLYLLVGTPAALDGVTAAGTAADEHATRRSANCAPTSKQAARRRAGLDAAGADLRTMQHDAADARDAYDHVLKLDPNNAEAMVGWAESRLDGCAPTT